ncbi:MAG: quinone-dependent dihydroorotate dehydrogenase [Verrucomicrobiota bacterium]
MDIFYEKLVRPLIFQLDPEKAHSLGRSALRLGGSLGPLTRFMTKRNQGGLKPVVVAGIEFPNRVGLAAGMDKDAEFVLGTAATGFGHVEVGTVTPKPQPGNPRPRLFRYPAEEALINRMGFNNGGMEAMADRLRRLPAKGSRSCVVGINIGKNRDTPLRQAADDYTACLRHLREYADYFTVNVSSPNTPSLRDLQAKGFLGELLGEVLAANESGDDKGPPIFVKIAPDLNFHQIGEILEVIEECGADGIVAANTSLGRDGLSGGRYQEGGLSGRPIGHRATEVVRFIGQETRGRMPLIGVGGIMDAASAGEKLDAGAHLIQVYTGWVYRGPFFAKELAKALRLYGSLW